jgi:hypothetical protein
MKKLIGASLLTVTLLWIGTDTIGQDRKQRPTARAGTIGIIESRDGKFRFSVRDAEGKYVGGSAVGHETAKEARDAVEELRKALSNATYVNKKSENTKDDRKEKNDK